MSEHFNFMYLLFFVQLNITWNLMAQIPCSELLSIRKKNMKMQTQIFNAITYYFLFSVCSWVYLLLRLLLVHLKTCLERFLIKNISIIWARKNEIYVLFFMLGWNLLWKKIYSNWKFILISFFYIYILKYCRKLYHL